MRPAVISLAIWLILCSACHHQIKSEPSDSALISLEEGFNNPPVSVRPKGYRDWMNGNFNLERLTYELEQANPQGMAGYGAGINPFEQLGRVKEVETYP